MKKTKKPSKKLAIAVAKHTDDVKKGCTCRVPEEAHGMIFLGRSAECPLHGER